MVFLPTSDRDRQICEQMFEQVVREEGQKVLGWRTVPIDASSLGATARKSSQSCAKSSSAAAAHWRTTSPSSASCTSSAGASRTSSNRRRSARPRAKSSSRAGRWTSAARSRRWVPANAPCSTCRACRTRRSSTRACSTPASCRSSIPDLNDPALASALALVHSRFSTNTFPTWARCAPLPLRRPTTARSTRCAATSTG